MRGIGARSAAALRGQQLRGAHGLAARHGVAVQAALQAHGRQLPEAWRLPAQGSRAGGFGVRWATTAAEEASEEDDPRKKAAAAAAAQGNQVVLSKRLPEDYVENTLRPHLESQLLDNIHVYSPAELAQISRAYSKQDVRQRALVQKLADTVKMRISAFEAVDIVDILGALWAMIPGDDELFEVLEERILLKIEDFTALNFMGIIRIYNKRASKHHSLLEKVIPRLRELLRNYEGIELSEMLVSIAQSPDAAADMDILMSLVPEIERRYDEVSLVHCINNIWALTQLKMAHQGLLQRVAEDLKNPKKTKDLTPGFLARIAWVYRRCNAWDLVSEAMLPLLRDGAAEFRCGEFARLAQALPEERVMLQRIADVLQGTLADMGRKDFLLFFLGCVHGELMEEQPAAERDRDSLASVCLQYAREDQDNFKRDEVQKIVYLLAHAPRYRHLLDELPASWKALKEETLDYIRAKG